MGSAHPSHPSALHPGPDGDEWLRLQVLLLTLSPAAFPWSNARGLRAHRDLRWQHQLAAGFQADSPVRSAVPWNAVRLLRPRHRADWKKPPRRARLRKLPNVRHYPPVEADALPGLYASADLHAATRTTPGLWTTAFRSRYWKCAAGLPVVTTLMKPIRNLASAVSVCSDGTAFVHAAAQRCARACPQKRARRCAKRVPAERLRPEVSSKSPRLPLPQRTTTPRRRAATKWVPFCLWLKGPRAPARVAAQRSEGHSNRLA